MKNLSIKNAVILRTVGILIITGSQIISHFVQLSDLTKGLFMGVGIGMLLISLNIRKLKKV